MLFTLNLAPMLLPLPTLLARRREKPLTPRTGRRHTSASAEAMDPRQGHKRSARVTCLLFTARHMSPDRDCTRHGDNVV